MNDRKSRQEAFQQILSFDEVRLIEKLRQIDRYLRKYDIFVE